MEKVLYWIATAVFSAGVGIASSCVAAEYLTKKAYAIAAGCAVFACLFGSAGLAIENGRSLEALFVSVVLVLCAFSYLAGVHRRTRSSLPANTDAPVRQDLSATGSTSAAHAIESRADRRARLLHEVKVRIGEYAADLDRVSWDIPHALHGKGAPSRAWGDIRLDDPAVSLTDKAQVETMVRDLESILKLAKDGLTRDMLECIEASAGSSARFGFAHCFSVKEQPDRPNKLWSLYDTYLQCIGLRRYADAIKDEHIKEEFTGFAHRAVTGFSAQHLRRALGRV